MIPHNAAIQKGIELKVHDSLVVNIDKWHDCWLLGLFEDQADPMRLQYGPEIVLLIIIPQGACGVVAVYPYVKLVRVDLIILHC